MEKLYSKATINRIKEKYGFHLSKSLGQNFLTDGNIVDHIIEGSAICETDMVIEIGPGIGVLTAAAAERAGFVIGVEIDRNLIPILGETLAEYDNVSIIHQDFLRTDINTILQQGAPAISNEGLSLKIIGNLPYYITTPIIMKVLEDRGPRRDKVESLTIMMQKEVADRIRAIPGSKAYGALSVAVQFYCTVEIIASVSKEVFIPKPKVDSTVLLLRMRKEPPVELLSNDIFFGVVKAGFGQRRKTLENALTGIYGMQKVEIRDALEDAGIDPMRRAETLDIKEFGKMANRIAEIRKIELE
jgi:16S rRNA (adenine1518-N6/adenine1519-N6)-dimethyltransferase